MVTCADTAEEAVKRLVAADLVEISLDESRTIVDIVSQKPFFLNADNVAAGSFNSLVDLLDETFCLARSFASCNLRNHLRIPPKNFFCFQAQHGAPHIRACP